MRTRMNKTKRHALDVFCISFALAATARTLDVTAYGVKPDGVTDNTAAIQKAIDDCSAKGGGRVLVPGGGAYMTPTVHQEGHGGHRALIDKPFRATCIFVGNDWKSTCIFVGKDQISTCIYVRCCGIMFRTKVKQDDFQAKNIR